MDSRRSLSIVLIVIYSGVTGILGVLMFLLGLLVSSFESSGIMYLITTFTLGFSVIHLACSYGLWTNQSWGRGLTYWVNLLSIPLTIITELYLAISGQPNSIGGLMFSAFCIAINIAIVIKMRGHKLQIAYR